MFALFLRGDQRVGKCDDEVGHERGSVSGNVNSTRCDAGQIADFCCKQCTWNYTGGRGVGHAFTKQNLAMVWDYAETNPFNPNGASWPAAIADIPCSLAIAAESASRAALVRRGSATELPWTGAMFDAVLTDPPYYDNVPYADVSDFFYVWLKRSVGHFMPSILAAISLRRNKKQLHSASARWRYGEGND